MSTCNSATQLYCSPDKNDLCFDNETYSLTFNSKFSTLNAKKLVDIYLFHGDDGTIAMEFPSRENDGDYPFTIDETWFTDPPATTTQSYPYKWFVVPAGATVNAPKSSSSFGPVFFAVQTHTIVAQKTTTDKASSTTTAKARTTDTAQATSTTTSKSIPKAIVAGTPTSDATPTSRATPTSTFASDANISGSAIPVNVTQKSSGLPVGAIAGIVIAIIALGAFVLAIFFFRRRRQSRQRLSGSSGHPPPPPHDMEKAAGAGKFMERGSGSTSNTNMEVPLGFAPGTAPGTPRTLVDEPRFGSSVGPNAGPNVSQRTLVDTSSPPPDKPPKSPNQQLIRSFPMPTPVVTPESAHFPRSAHSSTSIMMSPTSAHEVDIQPVQIASVQAQPIATVTRQNSKRALEHPFPLQPPPGRKPLPQRKRSAELPRPSPLPFPVPRSLSPAPRPPPRGPPRSQSPASMRNIPRSMSPAPRPEMRRPSTMERENPATKMASKPVSIVQGVQHTSLAGSISGKQEPQDPPSWQSIRQNLQQQIQLNKAKPSNLTSAAPVSPLTPPTPNFPELARPETPNRSFLEDRNALAPFTGSLVESGPLTETSLVVEPSDANISRGTSSVFEGKGEVDLPKGMLNVEAASPRTSSLVDLYGSGDTTPVFDTTPPLAISKVDHETSAKDVGKEGVVEESVKTPSVAPSLSLPAFESSRPLSLGIHLHSN